MTEKEISAWLYARYKEGEARYDSGEPCPHSANTIASLMDMLGWCFQDQRRAHMEHNPVYRKEQERFEREGIFARIRKQRLSP